METKFDFNDGSNDDLKKNASGLFKSINILLKEFFRSRMKLTKIWLSIQLNLTFLCGHNSMDFSLFNIDSICWFKC